MGLFCFALCKILRSECFRAWLDCYPHWRSGFSHYLHSIDWIAFCWYSWIPVTNTISIAINNVIRLFWLRSGAKIQSWINVGLRNYCKDHFAPLFTNAVVEARQSPNQERQSKITGLPSSNVEWSPRCLRLSIRHKTSPSSWASTIGKISSWSNCSNFPAQFDLCVAWYHILV